MQMKFDIDNVVRNTIILKTLKIAIFTYYVDFKLMNKKLNINIKTIILLVTSGIISGIIRYYINYIVSTISLIILISLIFFKDNIGRSIVANIISLSINYVLDLISIIICFNISILIRINNDYIKLGIITILHMFLIYFIFRIKKFKYGIQFLQKDSNDEYIDVLVLNASVILLFFVIAISNSENKIVSIISMEVIMSIIIMFITIKKSLNLYYKQKMLIKELEETKTELNSKNKEIEELEKENLTFKKRSHTLIHQQKSLEYKIQQIMMQTEISKEQAGEIKARLEKIAEEIYKEKENIELDKTGITEIDDILKYMQSECNKNKIEFILKIEGNIHQMINNAVSKEELEILLADHIKNAIIAINHTDNINRTIMVKLGKIDSIYSINIYDTGAEFEPETLDNLGKKPSTTHAEEGGTGMGVMNTFETLEKYKASLTIEEYNKPSKDNYTKLISIKFDNKNQFKIKSYRR